MRGRIAHSAAAAAAATDYIATYAAGFTVMLTCYRVKQDAEDKSRPHHGRLSRVFSGGELPSVQPANAKTNSP